jgi:CheY-like chemotaxis protein
VLLIDDDPDARETMSFILESAGYCVRTATNGFEGIERLRSEQAPCLILLDLMMPVMNGWEFRDAQVRDPKLAAIPIVVVTGAGQAVRRGSSLAADVLEKPVTLEALMSTVQRYCECGLA